jgi:hypothetical protein
MTKIDQKAASAAARLFTRRTALKAGAAASAVALASPALVRSAFSSSGELNFMGWSGYPDLAAKVFPAFEKATGIKVNFLEQPDQDSMFAQAKLSLRAAAVDVSGPTRLIAPGVCANASSGAGIRASSPWMLHPRLPTGRRQARHGR